MCVSCDLSRLQVMVLPPGKFLAADGRLSFGTRLLEDEPGDMLASPAKVFANVETNPESFAARFRTDDPGGRAELSRIRAMHGAVANMHGQVLEGTVKSFFKDKEDGSIEHGAFIHVVHNDVIVQGLLRCALVSHDDIDKVSDVFSVGDKVKVRSALIKNIV